MMDLKECPFCGKTKPVRVATDGDIDSHGYFAVICDYLKGGCGSASGYHKTADKAVEAWNHRASKLEQYQKMLVIQKEWKPSQCPSCKNDFSKYEPCNDGYYKRACHMDRCPYCGQKLKWHKNA